MVTEMIFLIFFGIKWLPFTYSYIYSYFLWNVAVFIINDLSCHLKLFYI